MTKKQHVQQPKQFQQTELDALIEQQQDKYKSSLQSAERVEGAILYRLLEKVISKSADGYALSSSLPPPTHRPNDYSVWLIKPEAMQELELIHVAKDVEAAYRADIDAYNRQQVDLLAEQLYAQAVAKEEKAQIDKEAKQRAEALAKAQFHIDSILKPNTKEQH